MSTESIDDPDDGRDDEQRDEQEPDGSITPGIPTRFGKLIDIALEIMVLHAQAIFKHLYGVLAFTGPLVH